MLGSSGALTGFTVALSHPQGIAIRSVGNCSTRNSPDILLIIFILVAEKQQLKQCGQCFKSTLRPVSTVHRLGLPKKNGTQTMADIHKLTDDLSVAPQLVASDIDDISQLKFRSILCNRPDQEEQGQPEYDDIRKLAEAAGIEVRFQPVNGAAISDVDVDEFESNIEELPKPVLAYCRSGTRCTVLWALSEAGKQSADNILKTASDAGYPLDALKPRIVDRE